MDELSTKETKKKANKVAIRFIVLLVGLYLLFSQGNLFMNSVTSAGSRYYNPYIAEYFNYIQWIKSALLIPATWLIKLFGFYAIHNEMDIMVVDGPYLRVNYSCVGLGVMSFLTAFIIAFPAKLKSKLKLFAIGIVMIYVLNVLRIAGLGVLLGFFQSQRSNFTYHHEIFNVIVYLCVFALLYFWIKKNTAINKS
ncbi:exosortase Y [Pedobacter insulae]|uniref:Exosortase/archaeosortase family protein n=1 Tax=Pedobacter insulae TaxID=414048 RepID=A0A1I2VVZ8_9SPHI|nr:archaeosortase/exosortase family protein [Pedobacter insulae]SFG93290.1 exosortase/archaeosortase family protein [Pedobacter insulae]